MDTVKSEIGAGADVNELKKDGWTPLHYAAHADKVSVAETLIAHGADVDARNSKGQSPLGIARASGSKSVEELLIAHGTNSNRTVELRVRDGQIGTCRFLFSFHEKMRTGILGLESAIWKVLQPAGNSHWDTGSFCGIAFFAKCSVCLHFRGHCPHSAGDWRYCPNSNCTMLRGT